MHRFSKRILAIGLAVMGMLATNTPAVSAADAGTIDFSVIITTPPLGYPPFNPQSGAVAITTTEVCAGASAGKSTAAGTCSISGAGNIGADPLGIGAFCGHSDRWITGTWHVRFFISVWLNFRIHIVTSGGVFIATGTATDPNTGQSGPITAEGVETPTGDPVINPGGGSCLAGTATQFRMVGTAEFAVA